MYFFTSGKCIPNALSWRLFPHSNAFFANIVWFMPQPDIQMHFSQKFFGLCRDSNVFFHFRKRIQMHFFSKIVEFMPRRSLPEMHSKCSFHGDCFHIQMHFLKYCLVFASTQMYFFASANAFQMLIHSAYFHIQISSDCNVHLHESVRTRERALARVKNVAKDTTSTFWC